MKKIKCCTISGCKGVGVKDKNGVECFAKGYCAAHYAKFKKYGNAEYKHDFKSATTCCKIANCKGQGNKNKKGTIVFPLGFCAIHYTRFKKYGNPLEVKVVRGEERGKNLLYTTYRVMKDRCYNSNSPDFKHYGGRGILVCPEWHGTEGFNQFCKDMGERPKGCTLDRIKVNGNYEASNCRWANKFQQAANRRNNNKVVGVHWFKRDKKWQAQIKINGKTINLGRYLTHSEAAQARRAAEILHNIY